MHARPRTHVDDPLIDEVRALRRAICSEVGNDVERLAASLHEVEREFQDRSGAFSGVTPEAAERVTASWGDDPYHTDDSLIDEIRTIRRGG